MYIFPHFGILHQGKSGNPALERIPFMNRESLSTTISAPLIEPKLKRVIRTHELKSLFFLRRQKS
jgi:hypothetical protein